MLEDLAVAIDDLDVPTDRESLVEAIALRDRLDARIAAAVGEFETNGWWAVDASASMTAWLRAHARMTRRSAQRLRSTAMRLRALPVCARAYAEGTLSGGQIEAIVARLDDDTVEIFAAQEAELATYLMPLTVAGVSQAMSVWVTRARPEPSEPKEPERSLHLSPTLDDRWDLDGALDPEGGAVVAAALRLATPDSTDIPGDPAARRADALVDVCRFFLDHQRSRAGGRHRPHVNVIVELEDLLAGRGGRVVDGPSLDGPTVSRRFCDSAVHRVVMAGRSSILDYGTSTRTIPAPLWNALVIRDEHCRFPGCDRPSGWGEGHHVVWVTQGGTTELANLVLVCSRHHHVLHQPGWHAKLRPDGTFKVTDPNGQVRCTSPPRAEMPW
ncbi:MAG TPA: DUF222 domain-containing protein [Egibacteraceae bacterium]|nr:DUF222 domain-containing protein [Egibacteraceae bacterium]